jgi:ATP-dependent RNA helicase RhlE
MTFDNLNLISPILHALKAKWYTTPSPIQEKAIPIILEGKDIFWCAQTGTWKTASFAIPMIQLLHAHKKQHPPTWKILALILTPTRELAIQIGENFAAYWAGTWITHTVIFGWVGQSPQVKAVRKGADVVIATPGRLLDLMNQKHISLAHIRMFVLDEADRMLDMGFINDIKKVLKVLPNKRQSLFFSATMPAQIMELAHTILKDPIKVMVSPVSSTVATVKQELYFVEKVDKRALLVHLLKDTSIESALVFTRTKHGADKVAKILAQAGITTAAIHGNKSQGARQTALQNLKNKKIRVLVATDIAARWIDINELSHVFIYDIPTEPETYVHRIGRTGRAGAKWVAIAFCDSDEKKYLKEIIKVIKQDIPVIEEHPFSGHSKKVSKK